MGRGRGRRWKAAMVVVQYNLHVLSLSAGLLSVYQLSRGIESIFSPSQPSLALLCHRVRGKTDIREGS